MTENVREAAFHLLMKTVREKGYSNFVYESAVAASPEWDQRDRAFLKNLFFGALRNLLLLDHIAQTRLKGDFSRLPEKIRMALRLGIYQIISMDKVPHKAAISASINLAKKYGHAGTARLASAVLNRISREKDQISAWILNNKADTSSDLSILYSLPEQLVSRYIEFFGYDTAVSILKAMNEIPPQNLRVRDWGALEAKCQEWGVDIEKNGCVKSGAEIPGLNQSRMEYLITNGIASYQDQSSIIAAELMSGCGGRGLELCCGRGNKSGTIFNSLGGNVFYVAADISMNKLREFKKTVSGGRMHPICLDVKVPLPFKGGFDWIFLDAPCSNLGTVRRHPEIKYRKSPAGIAVSAEAQSAALNNAAGYLNKGGRLLYSVCSFEPEETFGVIAPFLAGHKSFAKIDLVALRPDLAEKGMITDGCLRVFPGQYKMDGFFAALLERKR